MLRGQYQFVVYVYYIFFKLSNIDIIISQANPDTNTHICELKVKTSQKNDLCEC